MSAKNYSMRIMTSFYRNGSEKNIGYIAGSIWLNPASVRWAQVLSFSAEGRMEASFRWYSLGILKPLSGEKDILVLAVIRDFTERKRAEHELRYLNSELEAFAYAVSHDLKAPLRRIEGFIQMLSEDYSEKLDDQGRDYITRIMVASRKMQNLTDALLRLSRFAFGALNRSTVYLSTLAITAATNLRKFQPKREVEFIIAEDVKAEGDPSMLWVVIDNLIGNAWKFTEKRPDTE